MPDSHQFPEPSHGVNPALAPHYSIANAKRWATEEYGAFSQKEHLAHITLDAVDQALKTLASLGIRARLASDDSETSGPKFPLMLHKGETFRIVEDETELEDAVNAGWVDKTTLAQDQALTEGMEPGGDPEPLPVPEGEAAPDPAPIP